MNKITLKRAQDKMDRYLEIRRLLNSEVDVIDSELKINYLKAEATEIIQLLYSSEVEETGKSFLDTYNAELSEEDSKVKGNKHIGTMSWSNFSNGEAFLGLGVAAVTTGLILALAHKLIIK